MSFTTDPATRHALITGLRALADYLDQHPAVPVPRYGTEIYLSASSTDDGAALRSASSPASSASPLPRGSAIPATTRPPATSARSATG